VREESGGDRMMAVDGEEKRDDGATASSFARRTLPGDLLLRSGRCLRCGGSAATSEELVLRHDVCVEWIRGMEWQLKKRATTLTTEDIVKQVARYFRMLPAAILGGDRHKSLARARHIAIWLCHERLPDLSFPELGRAFGKDHTTIMSAVNRIGALMEEEGGGRLREDIAAIESLL
jgi:hypothetical protein